MLAAMHRRVFIAAAGAGAAWPALAATPSMVRPRPLVFPADFGAHPATRTEWWYVTGSLRAGDRLFGFQVTFFRSATGLAASDSRFAARQLVFAHAALSDVAGGRLRHDQRLARAGFGIAEAAEGDTLVSLRDWSMRRDGPADAGRYTAHVRSDNAGFMLDLAFATTQPVLLQGEAGYSRKGPQPGNASFYYSQPQLRATGTLTLDGRAMPVQGRAWLDQEWGDLMLDPQAVGWDWIGMNLDDGSALMAFRHRRADGSTLYAGGSFRAAGGAVRSFASDEVRFVPGRTWTSPASRTRYPVEWAVETPTGRYRVKALFDSQELDSRASTGSFYWEGLSELLTEPGQHAGLGYLEMTGYAAPMVL